MSMFMVAKAANGNCIYSVMYRVFQKSWAHFDNECLGNY